MNGIEHTLNQQASDVYKLRQALEAIVQLPVKLCAISTVIEMKRIAREALEK